MTNLPINDTVRNRLEEIYRRLLDTYGPQHWWPADESFEVMVGAILTQSVAWKNVEKAIENLKNAGVMSPSALRKLSLPEIADLIRPGIYYNVKAQKLKALVDWLGERYQDDPDELRNVSPALLRKELLSVWGIGEETADSIILYAAGKPVFVIDAYTRRIINRIGLGPDKDKYAAYQSLFMDNLPADAALFNEYHALLVRLGKEVCRKSPLCDQCCLRDICRSALSYSVSIE
jgi:endonuclease-3 related protein